MRLNPAIKLLALILLPGLLHATPSGLNNIPTADTPGQGDAVI
jgi:hypothetical protein